MKKIPIKNRTINWGVQTWNVKISIIYCFGKPKIEGFKADFQLDNVKRALTENFNKCSFKKKDYL